MGPPSQVKRQPTSHSLPPLHYAAPRVPTPCEHPGRSSVLVKSSQVCGPLPVIPEAMTDRDQSWTIKSCLKQSNSPRQQPRSSGLKSCIVCTVDGESLCPECVAIRGLCRGMYVDAGHLRLVEPLSRTGAGDVDLCVLRKQQPQAADIKVVTVRHLPVDVLRGKADMLAFIQQAACMRSVHHRNLVEFVGIGSHSLEDVSTMLSNTYIVESHVEATTLSDLIQAAMEFPHKHMYSFSDALHYAQQLASALNHLHTCSPQVVHGNLKPASILTQAGKEGLETEALLTDYWGNGHNWQQNHGRMDFLRRLAAGQPCSDPQITQARVYLDNALSGNQCSFNKDPGLKCALGSKQCAYTYMAPEQVYGSGCDEKVDVFAFGTIVYEMFQKQVTAAGIFGGLGPPSATALMALELYAYKVAAGYRQHIPDDWPPGLRQLIKECWHTDPRARPSMADVLDRLSDYALVLAVVDMDAAAHAAANARQGALTPRGSARRLSWALGHNNLESGSFYLPEAGGAVPEGKQGCGCTVM